MPPPRRYMPRRMINPVNRGIYIAFWNQWKHLRKPLIIKHPFLFLQTANCINTWRKWIDKGSYSVSLIQRQGYVPYICISGCLWTTGRTFMENGTYISELQDYSHYTDQQQKKASDAFLFTMHRENWLLKCFYDLGFKNM